MSRLEQLYSDAVRIETTSTSPRILGYHESGRHCEVGIGISDPELTEYLFVSLNPGAHRGTDGSINHAQDPIVTASAHPTMVQYLGETFPHARNIRKFIKAFATAQGTSFKQEAPKFGTTNLSFFYSKTSGQLGESFFVEIGESFPVLRAEVSVPRLKALIFSGVSWEHFFYSLYQPGSRLADFRQREGKHTWMHSFRTTLVTGTDSAVVFIVHLSATRGLTNESIASLGTRFAQIL
jgi:hypothetical protein